VNSHKLFLINREGAKNTKEEGRRKKEEGRRKKKINNFVILKY